MTTRPALRLLLCAAIAAAEPARLVWADSSQVSVNTAQFLTLGSGSRALGMGEAFTAVADDANAVYWNPAGMALLKRPEISVTHAEHLGDIHYETANAVVPLELLKGSIGLGFTYLRHDTLQAVNNLGVATGESFTPQSYALSAGYATAFKTDFGQLDAGLCGKAIREQLFNKEASAYAVDMGGLLTVPYFPKWRLGAALRNLGTKERFINDAENLPAEADFGVAYLATRDDGSRGFILSAEAAVPYYGDNYGKFGAEHRLPFGSSGDYWATRVGFKTLTAEDINPLTGLTVGGGFTFRHTQWDIAYQGNGALGNIFRFSFTYRFGTPAPSEHALLDIRHAELPPEHRPYNPPSRPDHVVPATSSAGITPAAPAARPAPSKDMTGGTLWIQ